MGKGKYDNYDYVRAQIVMAAAVGDDDMLDVIFHRFEGHITDLILTRIHEMEMSVDYFPVDEIKHTVWIGMKDAVRKYRPK